MFETAGSLAILQPVLTLVGLIGLPFAWALVATLSRVGKTRSPNRGLVPLIFCITCALGTLGLTVVLASRLALLPRNHVLLQHVSQLGRLGQLDLALDLALDPRSAAFAVVIAIIGCASALHTACSTRPGGGTVLAWTGLATTGALLVCVGDGFAPLIAGLGILSLAGWGLSRGRGVTPNVASLGGNVAALLGLMFLFWSLGGAFGSEGYDPDGAPRFVLVATGVAQPVESKAVLAMTTHAGALVSSDDADLPGEPIVAPFSILVEPGVYTLRVQGGAASGDVVVPRVALTAGRAHVLSPYGPTASLRVLDDQVAVPRLAATGAAVGVRASLAGRSIIGLRASAIVLLLLIGGALAHVHTLASRPGPAAIALVLAAVPAPYLALRLSPLIDPTAADGALVVVLGAGSAIALAARAACVDDGHKALRGVLAAAVSVAVASTGLGESSAALVLACSALVATSSALAAIDARRDVRWLGVACATAVGLLPGAGASSGYILAVSAALGSAATGSPAWAIFTACAAAVIVISAALAALAAFRVYDAVIHASVREPGVSAGQGAVVVALAVIALVGGTALGAGTVAFGGTVVPLARRLAWPAAPLAPRTVAGAAVVLSLISSVGGVILARRASLASAPPAWLLALGRPYAAFEWTVAVVGRVAQFLERSVRAMDRDVIDDVPAAMGDAVTRAARALSRSGRTISERVDGPLEGVAGAVVVKLEMDDPRSAERLRTVVLLAMMALLGLVVLSSFLLH
jgi:hypothetical protein